MTMSTVSRCCVATSVLLCSLLARPVVAGVLDLQLTQVSTQTGVVDIVNAGDGSGRLFLVRQLGVISIIEDGVQLPTPFLNISGKVGSSGEEQGLLSLAFAPDYASSGLFFVWYTDNGGGTVLERYQVSGDPNVANPGSSRLILSQGQPFPNHNGGRLQFGPDGMLYLGLGDGGNAFDPDGNAQAGDTLLGKLIRIDVDPAHGTYAVPPDNPFINSGAVLNEIWALGLRNPWRISFDSQTGDLFIADVGQGQREEINFQPANSNGGENYGWDVMEGSSCVGGVNCNMAGFTLPVAEYGHDLGCSVTGGEVYRGGAYPNMSGMYFFGDYCSGRIWGLTRNGNNWIMEALADTNHFISTFGLGEDGSVYLAGHTSGIFLLSDGPVDPEPEFTINAGLNDTWYNRATPGQGFFITVFPGTGRVFLAWFSYETERPPANVQAILGEPGHRWLTALGPYAGNTAVLDIELTQGGVFDMSQPAPTRSSDGTIILEFQDCNTGTVSYDITSVDRQGEIPIERIALDNVPACEALQ